MSFFVFSLFKSCDIKTGDFETMQFSLNERHGSTLQTPSIARKQHSSFMSIACLRDCPRFTALKGNEVDSELPLWALFRIDKEGVSPRPIYQAIKSIMRDCAKSASKVRFSDSNFAQFEQFAGRLSRGCRDFGMNGDRNESC